MKLFLLISLSWSLFLAYTRAELVYSSSELPEPSPCPGFQQTNTTYLNVSVTPEVSGITVRLSSGGVMTSSGYAIFILALFGDGEPVLLQPFGDLEADGSPVDLVSGLHLAEQDGARLGESLHSAKNITAQLWIEDQEERVECTQTILRSNDESGNENHPTPSTHAGASNDNGTSTSDEKGSHGAGNEGPGNSTRNDDGSNSAGDEGPGNSTNGDNGSSGKSDGGPGNSTSDDNGSDGASAASTEESGANVRQVAFTLVM